RLEPRLGGMSAYFTNERQLVEPLDLALALDPGRMARREVPDQGADPPPELKREVGRRGAHQLADVLDRDLAPLAQAVRMFCLAHFCGTASSRLSVWAWTATEIALGSPMIQPWLYTAAVGPCWVKPGGA